MAVLKQRFDFEKDGLKMRILCRIIKKCQADSRFSGCDKNGKNRLNMGRRLAFFIAAGLILTGADAVATKQVLKTLKLDQKWTGDFDGIEKRHLLRVLMPYSKTFYFLDGADQRGATYDLMKEFEKYINKKSKKKTLKIKMVVVPTKRDRLLPALAEGLGDIAAGNLTDTAERRKLVDFSAPFFTGVDEIVVTGPGAPSIKTIDDLAGKEIHVRRSSSYFESLQKLNEKFKKAGKPPVILTPADELMEDEDLLEMMNAGLIQIIVIDSHIAEFWSQIFKKLKLHPDIKLRTGGEIAWAIRKNSPGLKKTINEFVRKHKKGTLLGNIIFKRYLKNTKWVQNPTSDEDRRRLEAAVDFFKKYGEKYQMDWLIVAALAYQESRINQEKKSHAGAIGVMQLLPSTAKDPNVNIPDIHLKEDNIHAGIKYLRFIVDRYYENEPMDRFNKALFAFASYNAGPAKVARLRREAKKMGLDPNVWFRNVEIVAAKRIGRETVQYVSNIYKYYTVYRLMFEYGKEKEKIKPR